MKSIENISPKLEKVILKGLEIAHQSACIELYQAVISLYNLEDTIFVHYQRRNTFSNKNIINFFEIKSTESYYLFDTINSIVEDLDSFGTEAGRQDSQKIYSRVIDFCKKAGFDYKDLEIALTKIK